MIRISPARPEDLEPILQLQRLAFRSEAELLNDYNIPPLRQTLEEVEMEYHNGILLKAINGTGKLIGSVRGHAAEGTLHIGKLMVHPNYQGCGFGAELLRRIESLSPEPRYELFTSDMSGRNIAFYERAGYRRFREQHISPGLTLVYLEKYTQA